METILKILEEFGGIFEGFFLSDKTFEEIEKMERKNYDKKIIFSFPYCHERNDIETSLNEMLKTKIGVKIDSSKNLIEFTIPELEKKCEFYLTFFDDNKYFGKFIIVKIR